MKQKAIKILEDQGHAAAIHHLQAQKDPLAVTTTLNDLARHAYWQLHDLDAAVVLAQSGIEYGSEQAKAAKPEIAREINLLLRAITYNLASYTWPGWNEDWIEEIPADFLHLGMDAAKSCLALTQELEESELRYSRAAWMLAAHQLAAGQYEEAQANFSKAIEHAERAEAHADILLSHGFNHIVVLVKDAEDPGAQSALEAIKTELGNLEDGKAFIQQLDDALGVFG